MIYGIAGLGIAYLLFILLPSVFLPQYAELDSYNVDLYPTIARVIHDNRQAIMWLGLYLGFLLYEITQKNWHGVRLILLTGIGTGILWPLFQRFFWYFVPEMIFPTLSFNWWRVWESAAGGAIGLVYGIAFIMQNKPRKINKVETDPDTNVVKNLHQTERFEHLIAYITIWSGIMLGVTNGLKGMDTIYGFTEVNWHFILLPVILLGIIGLILLFRYHPNLKKSSYPFGEVPYFSTILIAAYLIHRLSIFFSTGPLTNPVEILFVFYYLVLTVMDLTLIIVRLWFLHILKQ